MSMLTVLSTERGLSQKFGGLGQIAVLTGVPHRATRGTGGRKLRSIPGWWNVPLAGSFFLFSLRRKPQAGKIGDEAQEKKPSRYLPRIPRALARGGLFS